jgi:hypothetical protein
MTELDLYKFIKENCIEWHKQDNDGTEDVVIFLYIFELEEFCKLFQNYNEDDGGLVVHIVNNRAAIWMNDLCDYYGIDIDKVFKDD